jgi:hypothetical protein
MKDEERSGSGVCVLERERGRERERGGMNVTELIVFGGW